MLCFKSAAVSDDHTVLFKLNDSVVKYSAFELALGIAALTHHEANRTAFAHPDIFSAVFELLKFNGSIEENLISEKLISIQLLSKLVCEPDVCFTVLANHPEILEVLQSYSDDTLCQEATKLLTMLLNGVSGIAIAGFKEISPAVDINDAVVQRKTELKQLLSWATLQLNSIKTLNSDYSTEFGLSMIFLISHIQEMQHFESDHLSLHSVLLDCPEFLTVLQDYNFISMYS